MDAWFKNKQGRVVLYQVPNKWFWWAALGYVAGRSFEDSGHIDVIGLAVFYGAGGYWAWLEITEGVNTFRRVIGVVVVLVLVRSLAMRFIT